MYSIKIYLLEGGGLLRNSADVVREAGMVFENDNCRTCRLFKLVAIPVGKPIRRPREKKTSYSRS